MACKKMHEHKHAMDANEQELDGVDVIQHAHVANAFLKLRDFLVARGLCHSELLERGLCLVEQAKQLIHDVLCGSVRLRLSERPSRRAVVSGDSTLFLQMNASLNMFC